MRKSIRTPPISGCSDEARGKPWTSTPTCVELPPMSTTTPSSTPLRKAAPRMPLAGPLPTISSGKRSACPRAMTAPSFCAKNGSAAMPSALRV